MTRRFPFPDPVNEVAARLVAAGVVVMAAVTLAFGLEWMLWVLAYGFVARVLTGPAVSPLALLVTRVVVPRLALAERPVPGPPKRFAQGIGAGFTVSALVAVGLGRPTVAFVLIGMLLVAAALEAFVGFCLGCAIFALLMRIGVIPEAVCERCADLRLGPARSGPVRS